MLAWVRSRINFIWLCTVSNHIWNQQLCWSGVGTDDGWPESITLLYLTLVWPELWSLGQKGTTLIEFVSLAMFIIMPVLDIGPVGVNPSLELGHSHHTDYFTSETTPIVNCTCTQCLSPWSGFSSGLMRHPWMTSSNKSVRLPAGNQQQGIICLCYLKLPVQVSSATVPFLGKKDHLYVVQHKSLTPHN